MLAAVSADGARADLYLHGAHLTSWRPAGGDERIFLSQRAAFAPDTAIRGGVPIIFPQFDREGPLPRHGFARVSEWKPVSAGAAAGGSAHATLRLNDSAATRAIWPQSFVVELTVTVGGAVLEIALTVRNAGASAFAFTGALHTYLRVDAVETAVVDGLAGTRFHDKVAGGGVMRTQSGVLRIEAETDRVYIGAPDRVIVREPLRALAVEKRGFADVVVWNPWDKGAELPDLEPDGFRYMLCVEAAAVNTPIRLDPGEQWTGVQRLTVL